MTDTRDDDGRGFLARWSQRKGSARIAETATPRDKRGGAAPVLPEEAPEDQLPALVTGDERPLSEEERELVDTLPDIEALDADSDFTPFMQSKVPEFLRRRALQVLWRSNPVLANVDGLVDYGEDFTDAARVIEGMQTAYRVGKGFMTDEELEETPDEEAVDGEDLPEEEEEARPQVAADEPEKVRTHEPDHDPDEECDGDQEDGKVGDGDLE
ncbi:DUF3306 domain-containing protein [Nisaea sp.]|uniref:DUF3306 domain-containing protein n=1 Tax=Nisaea sp. TaxID=2024842 RepID=UPI0032EB1782